MATSFFEARSGGSNFYRPQERGYHVVYRDHEVNHCPGCSRSQWLIGRLMAECAFCATALPLESGLMVGNQTIRHTRRSFTQDQALAA
ncbi:MAG TPA: hypothetical protein VGB54_06685 [Allosphingosinicella sp.]|jgi:hypothetical protein